MKTVQSSHIWQIGYDADTAMLRVRFRPTVKYPAGRLVDYAGVDEKTADRVLRAPSVGGAMHDLIRGRFDMQDVPDDQ